MCGTHRDPSLDPTYSLYVAYLTLKHSIVIEGGIFVSHGIWLIRTRKIRAKAKAAGCTFDDLPESEPYHVDIPRRGSIAASRDIEHVEIERRGSLALARERDLEAGRPSIGRNSVAKSVILEETESTADNDGDSVNVRVKDVPMPLDGQGVEETDYGTMAAANGEGRRPSTKRPGYVRQETSDSLFKDPVWGKKGVDE